MKSNYSIRAAYFETNADCEESDGKPLRDYLDPHRSWAPFKDVFFRFSIKCHISPICEEHTKVHGSKYHDELEDDGWNRDREDSFFFVFFILSLCLSLSIFSNDVVAQWFCFLFFLICFWDRSGCDRDNSDTCDDGACKNLPECVPATIVEWVALSVRIRCKCTPREVGEIRNGKTSHENGCIVSEDFNIT